MTLLKKLWQSYGIIEKVVALLKKLLKSYGKVMALLKKLWHY